MPPIMLQCKKCQKIFNSGIYMDNCSNITLVDNVSQCKYCGSMESIPNGTFNATVNGFVDIIKGSNNPLQEALDIFNGLKKIRTIEDLSNISNGGRIEKFLKDNQIKIAVALAIIKVIIELLKNQPDVSINNTEIINQNFYSQYNQYISVNIKDDSCDEN